MLRHWGQALRTMPSITPSQWQKLDGVTRWLVATRASVLVMTLSSSLIGLLLAVRADHFDAFLGVLCVLGLLFAHAANNLLNDTIDSARGVDKGNYYRNQYGVHLLESGLINQKQMWAYIAFTGGVAVLIGLALIYLRGGYTGPLMALGSFFVIFYTWPLKYIGLGEPTVLLVWGPLIVGGTFYVVTGYWQWDVIAISLLYALGPTSVLFGKHIDKAPLDLAKGIYSLPVILGDVWARRCVVAMLAVQYGLVLLFVAVNLLHWSMLIVLLNMPRLWVVTTAFQQPRPAERPDRYPAAIWPLWFSALAFDHTRRFSLLFVGALFADVVLL